MFSILVLITSPSVDIWMAQEKTQAPFIYSVFEIFCRLRGERKRDFAVMAEQMAKADRETAIQASAMALIKSRQT